MTISRILDRMDALMESDKCPPELGKRYLAFMQKLASKIKKEPESKEAVELEEAMSKWKPYS